MSVCRGSSLAGEERCGRGSTLERIGEKISILEVAARDLATARDRGINPNDLDSVERVLSPGDSSQSIAQELGEEESISVLSKTHHTTNRLKKLVSSRVSKDDSRRMATAKAII